VDIDRGIRPRFCNLGMFSALAPFLIEWYHFTSTQVLVLAAMEPLFAAAISIPLGIWADKYGGRTVFTLLLVALSVVLILDDRYDVLSILSVLFGLMSARWRYSWPCRYR